MARTTIQLGDFELDATNRRQRIDVGGAKSMRISAALLSGVWASRTIEVKKRVGRSEAVSFSTPRTFAAGGGAPLEFSEDDLAGIAELQVEGAGTVESGLVRLEASIEFDSVSEVWAVMPGIWRGGDGPMVRPGQPEEV